LSVEAEWTMAEQPHRVGQVTLAIHLPHHLTAEQSERLLKVAHGCTVHQSIAVPAGVAIELNSHHRGRSNRERSGDMNVRSRVVIGSAVLVLVGLISSPRLSFGSDQSRAKDIIQQTCVQCHRLEGKPDSRFNLKAPDLIWAGSKYQRSWLIRWLTGKEAPLYAKGYRWDLTEVSSKHPMVTSRRQRHRRLLC
jgi:hypothetical protein